MAQGSIQAVPGSRRAHHQGTATAVAPLLVCLVTASILPCAAAVGLLPRLDHVPAHPGVPDAKVEWTQQPLDHFDYGERRTWAQRYFTYDKHWKPGGPILFYCGNEANVELYVNATGLMWERAPELGALLVFGEHRYYGDSQPLGAASAANASTLRWLTMEQALADYAVLIFSLKAKAAALHGVDAANVPVVALGGSYGGMLAAWLRFRHPNAVVGAIAASAPVLAFDGMGGPGTQFDGNSYWQIVSADTSASTGGCVAGCADGVRATWPALFSAGATRAGRQRLSQTFRLCGKGVEGAADVSRLASWLLNLWDTLAMGNFPYPSNYLIFQQTHDPSVTLPAWPVRAACAPFAGATSLTPADDLLGRMAEAAGVLYNASGRAACNALPSDPNFDGIWDYQYCTERLPQETYFSLSGTSDIFWARPANRSATAEHCERKYGVGTKGVEWIAQSARFGPFAGTNVVFSNGEYDPWRAGGVVTDLGPTVRALTVAKGAHHLDLMFSNALDPDSVRAVREAEVDAMRAWIAGRSDW